MNLHAFLGVAWYAIVPMVAIHTLFDLLNLRMRNPQLWERWMWVYVPIFAGFWFFAAVDDLIRKYYVHAVISTGIAVWVTYMWWNDENNRRKRKKLLDRATARVAVIGTRLRVVRPSEG